MLTSVVDRGELASSNVSVKYMNDFCCSQSFANC